MIDEQNLKLPAKIETDWIQFNKIWNAGCISIIVNGYARLESRYTWECAHGSIPIGGIIHHIDGNKSNNYIFNLRLTDVAEHQTIHKLMRLELSRLPNN